MSKKALVVGATGLVGKELVKLLTEKDFYDEIVVVSRRPLDLKDDKIKPIVLETFDHLDTVKDQLNVHDVYCAIGTTRKKAGSKDAFLKIDLEYPIAVAMLTMDQSNFQQFLVVTSLGAKADSPLFYNRAKGKLEVALEKLNMRALKIFQPSLLLGKRDEVRLLEGFAKAVSAILSFFVIGSKKRIWSIHAHEVAEAMYRVAKLNEEGVQRHKPDQMLEIARH